MLVTVKLSAPLQKFTKGRAEVRASGKSIRELINNLEEKIPGIKEKICDETDRLHKFINIYVNEQDIRFLEHAETVLKDGDEVLIIPAIAGG
ncbi:MAG: MoaD family protein [Candidatus Omnitrophota bacterium]